MNIGTVIEGELTRDEIEVLRDILEEFWSISSDRGCNDLFNEKHIKFIKDNKLMEMEMYEDGEKEEYLIYNHHGLIQYFIDRLEEE